jgi:type IV secretory pathway TraG/TraD family ATPase VirD4
MPLVVEGLEYLAGYGITLCCVTPSLTPLEALYGTRNGFWEGSRIRLVFAPNSAAMAHVFARETGEAAVEKAREMVARDPFRVLRDKTTVSTETVLEPLLSPTALQQLPQETVLLLVGNAPPALLTKARYFTHRAWRARSRLPAPAQR